MYPTPKAQLICLILTKSWNVLSRLLSKIRTFSGETIWQILQLFATMHPPHCIDEKRARHCVLTLSEFVLSRCSSKHWFLLKKYPQSRYSSKHWFLLKNVHSHVDRRTMFGRNIGLQLWTKLLASFILLLGKLRLQINTLAFNLVQHSKTPSFQWPNSQHCLCMRICI